MTSNSLRSLAIALGAAALAPTLWAQPSVRLYGALDYYAGHQSASGSSARKVLNSGLNPNVFGIAGSEPLGGGLSAGFTLESQPAGDTGGVGQGGKFWGRQSLVYLEGGFGRLSMGRIHTAGRSFGIKYSATGWLSTDVLGNLAIASGSAFAPVMNIDGVGSRTSNSLAYQSPRWSGASFSFMQSAGEGSSFAAGSPKLTQLGFGYAAGPFSADLVYNRIPALPGNQIAQTDFAVGAQYAFSGARVMAAAFSRKGSAIAAPGAASPIAGSEATDRILLAGVSVPLGLHTVGFSVGRLQVADAHRGRRMANMSAPFSAAADDATAWSAAYAYSLSKRTQLFSTYGSLSNSALGQAAITADLRPTAGGRSALWATGVRHSF